MTPPHNQSYWVNLPLLFPFLSGFFSDLSCLKFPRLSRALFFSPDFSRVVQISSRIGGKKKEKTHRVWRGNLSCCREVIGVNIWCLQNYFYHQFPLINSTGQLILSATCDRNDSSQRKVTVFNFEYPSFSTFGGRRCGVGQNSVGMMTSHFVAGKYPHCGVCFFPARMYAPQLLLFVGVFRGRHVAQSNSSLLRRQRVTG